MQRSNHIALNSTQTHKHTNKHNHIHKLTHTHTNKQFIREVKRKRTLHFSTRRVPTRINEHEQLTGLLLFLFYLFHLMPSNSQQVNTTSGDEENSDQIQQQQSDSHASRMSAAPSATLSAPGPFQKEIDGSSNSARWKAWFRKFETFEKAAGLKEDILLPTLLNIGGEHLDEVVLVVTKPNDDYKKVTEGQSRSTLRANKELRQDHPRVPTHPTTSRRGNRALRRSPAHARDRLRVRQTRRRDPSATNSRGKRPKGAGVRKQEDVQRALRLRPLSRSTPRGKETPTVAIADTLVASRVSLPAQRQQLDAAASEVQKLRLRARARRQLPSSRPDVLQLRQAKSVLQGLPRAKERPETSRTTNRAKTETSAVPSRTARTK